MWHQGEHLLLIGQTGSGKTTLARSLMNLRQYCVMLVTKPDDLQWPGWRHCTKASDVRLYPDGPTRFRLEPPFGLQLREFWRVLAQVWQEGGWTVYVDETYYLESYLKLSTPFVQLLTQGRSRRITVVCGVQRPSRVSRFALSEPTHVLCARLGDRRDVKTVGEAFGEDYAEDLPSIPPFHFAYRNKRDGMDLIVTKDSVGRINGRA